MQHSLRIKVETEEGEAHELLLQSEDVMEYAG
jgi:hypothetical protein